MIQAQARQKWIQVAVLLLLIVPVIATLTMPVEDSVALLVCLVMGSVGVFCLSLIRDPRERAILLWIFIIAYALRVVFSLVAYGFGVVSLLGGADDTGWMIDWHMSRYWHGWLGNVPTVKHIPGQGGLPETFLQVYDRTRTSNLGHHFFVSKIFYYIDVPSQISIAFVNCFMNAMTAVVVYKIAREFFSEKGSLLAAGAVVIFPGYLMWSALTIKETWLILFEITTFFTLWRAVRDRSVVYAALTFGLIVLVLGFRFYVAWVLVAACLLSALCLRSPRPAITAGKAVGSFLLLFVIASGVGLIHIDIAGIVMKQMAEFETFRTAISSGTGPRSGTNSGVELPYDPTTPFGLVMLLLVGATYLLLSPFPWQMSGKQLLTLPDVLLWWGLVFFFIIPGIRYTWHRNQGLLISLLAFIMPLILLYSMVFGNIGLAYRQRAQLMPFLLVFAAAGYDARERRRRTQAHGPDRAELVAQLRRQLQNPAPTSPGMAAAGKTAVSIPDSAR